MCPDEKMFTEYLDDELDIEFKKIMDNHFEICEDCRNKKQEFLDLKQKMRIPVSNIDLDSSLSRVWSRLENTPSVPSWKKTRAINITLKAAVLVVFLVAGFFTGRYISSANSGKFRIPAQAFELKEQKLEEVSDYLYNGGKENNDDAASIIITESELQQLVDLLSSRSSVMEVKISLPKEKDFSIIGKPQIIRSEKIRSNK